MLHIQRNKFGIDKQAFAEKSLIESSLATLLADGLGAANMLDNAVQSRFCIFEFDDNVKGFIVRSTLADNGVLAFSELHCHAWRALRWKEILG